MKSNVFKNTVMTCTMISILTVNPIPAQAALGDTTLQYNMEDEDIKILQRELEDFGYLDLEGEFTSYYGDSTLAAVKALQADKGLEVTGIYETNTHNLLSKLKEERLDKYKLLHTNNLTLKDENSDVRALQEALRELRFLEIDNCTDYYGPMTESAVYSFQRAVGITVDGVAGARTFQMINKALAGEDVFIQAANRSGERNDLGQMIINTGMKSLGKPYVYATAGPNTFDCSGFTSYVYKQHGINLSRSSRTQAGQGVWIPKKDLQIGDLIIFGGTTRSSARSGSPSHVGIYAGDGQFIHASSYGGGVKFDSLNSNYYSKHYHSSRRVY